MQSHLVSLPSPLHFVPTLLLRVHHLAVQRALTLGLLLIATAATASSREGLGLGLGLGPKTQWAPSGNFPALHARTVFRAEFRSEARPYARARGEVAAGFGIFLSRDSIGASSYLSSPNSMGPWSYANLSPLRYTDPDGRDIRLPFSSGAFEAIDAAESARSWLPERHETVPALASGSTPYGAFLDCVLETTGTAAPTYLSRVNRRAQYETACATRLRERAGYESEFWSMVRPASPNERVSRTLADMGFVPADNEMLEITRSYQQVLASLGAPQKELRSLGQWGSLRRDEKNASVAMNWGLFMLDFAAGGLSSVGRTMEVEAATETLVAQGPAAARLEARLEGRAAAESSAVTRESIMRALRKQKTPEAAATAKLIKRGRVDLRIFFSDPAGANLGRAGSQPFGTNELQIYLSGVRNPWQAAGTSVHELRHWLQANSPANMSVEKLTRGTYGRLHEVDAFLYQRKAGFLSKTDDEIMTLVNQNPLYKKLK